MNEYPMCEVPRIDWMSGEPDSARMIGSVTSVSSSCGLRGHFDVDDDLRIGDVGDGVERRGAERVDAERRPAATDDEQTTASEADDVLDDGGDHRRPGPGYGPFSLCSASMKKLPNVTT